MNINGGKNIALKLSPSKYEETVRFYTQILGLPASEVESPDHPTVKKSTKIQFGENTLWLDLMIAETPPQAWLELLTDDMAATEEHLQQHGIEFEDHLEQIPAHMHWIRDPAGNVFILKEAK
ncbi:VOC family protein [Sphingobacterium sp. SYP-B4668]|uniref:VOC family protein n=1 Tax=Sphingobacterium sp. SYP-B4668 TaxID=2996035 RepID=UPI0022DCE5F9|nr:VOC family protein [Sphingobacterium sp. SYP-B4668]